MKQPLLSGNQGRFGTPKAVAVIIAAIRSAAAPPPGHQPSVALYGFGHGAA